MNIDWIVRGCNEILFGKKEKDINEDLLSVEELNKALSEATKHGMLAVLMKRLEHADIKDAALKKVVVKWYVSCERYQKKTRKIHSLMQKMAIEFGNAGLNVMFLKGATTAQLYPEPQLRMFDDIDYYLYGNSDKGAEVLESLGIKTNKCSHHHTRAYLKGVLLEDHYDFLDRKNHRGNLLMDDELKRLAAMEGHSYPFMFDNTDVNNAYCMSPTMNALFLMRHMGTHFFSETVPLRMLYDWALFLKKYAGEVDWEKTLLLYKESGMPVFPSMIQGILVSKLGLDFPNCPIEPICGKTTDRIWKSIIDTTESNPYKKGSVRFHLYEAMLFINNRWKHHLVFKGESYWLLFISFIWQNLRIKIKG